MSLLSKGDQYIETPFIKEHSKHKHLYVKAAFTVLSQEERQERCV